MGWVTYCVSYSGETTVRPISDDSQADKVSNYRPTDKASDYRLTCAGLLFLH